MGGVAEPGSRGKHPTGPAPTLLRGAIPAYHPAVAETTPGRRRGGSLHELLDRLAMAWEDRVARPPAPFRPGPEAPVDPAGPLPPPPPLRIHPARGRRAGTVVLVPPWKIRSTAVLAGWVRALRAAGLETWVAVPPFHLERTPRGERPGEGSISPDLAATGAALSQAVGEVRAAVALARRDGAPVGLCGLSLGALVAAWAACGPEPVEAAALVAPPADLLAVFRETAIGRRYAALAERAGAPVPPPDRLGPLLAGLSPLDRRPSGVRVLVVAGAHDRVAPGGGAALARAWGLPLRLLPRGHLSLLLGTPGIRREVAAFLSATSSPPAARP